jgi:uncharacterized protein
MRVQDLKWEDILLSAISGSHAYGLNTPTSDIDRRGIFIAPKSDFYSLHVPEQASDEKNDSVYYELKRFFDLLTSQNPNIIELLGVPADCVEYIDPIFNKVLENKEKFLTRKIRDTFGGYAIAQIGKARGMNKKIVQPMDKEKKTPLDFCFVPDQERTVTLKYWLAVHFPLEPIDEVLSRCGLSALNHIKDGYALFYDITTPINDKSFLRGICFADSNDVHLSDIPKQGVCFETIVFYNKDAYSIYCKEYKEYWDWVAKRNPARYEKNMEVGKGYDTKNMMHCVRLLRMAEEMLRHGELNVRRPDRDELLEIRDGKREYDELVQYAESKIKLLDELVIDSPLPEKIDTDLINKLLIEIRDEHYSR